MADEGKSIADKIAGFFNSSEEETPPKRRIPGGSGSPSIDPKKAKANEEDSQRSGLNPTEWKKNLKEGLGLGN
jgi:hypothetical protein